MTALRGSALDVRAIHWLKGKPLSRANAQTKREDATVLLISTKKNCHEV